VLLNSFFVWHRMGAQKRVDEIDPIPNDFCRIRLRGMSQKCPVPRYSQHQCELCELTAHLGRSPDATKPVRLQPSPPALNRHQPSPMSSFAHRYFQVRRIVGRQAMLAAERLRRGTNSGRACRNIHIHRQAIQIIKESLRESRRNPLPLFADKKRVPHLITPKGRHYHEITRGNSLRNTETYALRQA
jgi:hypothetical protein